MANGQQPTATVHHHFKILNNVTLLGSSALGQSVRLLLRSEQNLPATDLTRINFIGFGFSQCPYLIEF